MFRLRYSLKFQTWSPKIPALKDTRTLTPRTSTPTPPTACLRRSSWRGRSWVATRSSRCWRRSRRKPIIARRKMARRASSQRRLIKQRKDLVCRISRSATSIFIEMLRLSWMLIIFWIKRLLVNYYFLNKCFFIFKFFIFFKVIQILLGLNILYLVIFLFKFNLLSNN